ncbi:cell wall hydrolase [Methylocapsa palsarum]|nr:cell wall hydrolase [Methylocapsa palsarum]
MSAVAPWWLGLAFAVSIPADAGQEPSGASFAPLSWRAAVEPAILVPLPIPSEADFTRISGEAGRQLRAASLVIGQSAEFTRLADEIEPRADLKRSARGFPEVDREHKGDPIVGLRPEFDGKLRQPGGLAALRTEDLVFNRAETAPSSAFAASENTDPDRDAAAAFEPWPDGETPMTVRAAAEASPRQPGAVVTMRPAALSERLAQGATPPVQRAVALGSTTPSDADSTPVEVAALPWSRDERAPDAEIFPGSKSRPEFSALIDQDQIGREKRCLAEAIYFEARSEPEEGQAAVAQVVLNRVSSGLYPTTICGVVYQNRRHANACQFSFACEGRSLRVNDTASWRTAVRIADEVTTGKTYVAEIGDSTHYHANYVRPRWARKLEKTDVIGRHIFYKLHPGQT